MLDEPRHNGLDHTRRDPNDGAINQRLRLNLGASNAIAILVAWTGLRAGKTAEKAAEAQLDAVHASVIGQAIDDYQRLGRDMATLIDWYRYDERRGTRFP